MIKRLLLICILPLLAGCTTSSIQNFDTVLTTLHDDGCHTTVNLAVSVGATNPGSGFQAQGSVDCPPKTLGVVESAAPSAFK